MRTDKDCGRWSNRPQKEDCRRYAVEELPRLQRSLWLPGDGLLDIEVAQEVGVIDKNSQMIFAERNPDVIPKIENKINNGHWLNKPLLHKGKISDLELPWPIQFAFLDYCGCYERDTVRWMNTGLAARLEPGATVVITHMQSWRNNNFIHECHEALWRGPMAKHTARISRNLGVRSENMALVLAVTLCIFNRYDFKIQPPVKYQDSRNSMFMLRFDNLRQLPEGKTNGWPDLAELVDLSKTSTGDTMSKKSISPAQAKKRSDAAYKAWETRRRNAEMKPQEPTNNKNKVSVKKLDEALRLLREIKNSCID